MENCAIALMRMAHLTLGDTLTKNSGNGLGPITWVNNDPELCRHVASSDHSELAVISGYIHLSQQFNLLCYIYGNHVYVSSLHL